ncbi:MAG: WYL domain-containing protein [Clostridia bacterium]|nr:WYL domain-containing protein [Clostridia bacterium]
MPRSSNHKLKLLYLTKILTEKTDAAHPLTLTEIQSYLEGYDIYAERKSLYDDFEALRRFGADVEIKHGTVAAYYMASRTFQLPELKLLVDAVQSSKFITKKKSAELIEKLSSLASEHEKLLLNRQVYVANRVKTFNEEVYYNVDAIHEAIGENKKIAFQYYEWTVKKEKRLRHDGALYTISPWAMTWDDDNYYMIGYDSEAGIIKHFRVDKMTSVKLLDELRDGSDKFGNIDMGLYSKQVFGMYGGEREMVTLECDNQIAGVIIDTFGKETVFFGNGDRFLININVAVSPTFLSWVFGFGDRMKIVSPQSVVNEFKDLAAKVIDGYK